MFLTTYGKSSLMIAYKSGGRAFFVISDNIESWDRLIVALNAKLIDALQLNVYYGSDDGSVYESKFDDNRMTDAYAFTGPSDIKVSQAMYMNVGSS